MRDSVKHSLTWKIYGRCPQIWWRAAAPAGPDRATISDGLLAGDAEPTCSRRTKIARKMSDTRLTEKKRRADDFSHQPLTIESGFTVFTHEGHSATADDAEHERDRSRIFSTESA